MKAVKWVVVIMVLVLVGTLTVGAFQPTGWLYSQWPYAYSMNETAWYYFNVPSTQWRVSLPGGVWQLLSQGGTATGWNYYRWPYCYSMTAGGWFYMDVNSVQWCVNLNNAQWSEFGAPSGMVLIPAGNLVMGNATNIFPAGEGQTDELPQHTVNVSGFYMDRHEMTKALWDEVKTWAATHGYAFDHAGSGKAANHPVHTVSWYDVVKWCNARSQKEGLTPCYTANGVTYKTGNNSNVVCNWSANGYRLPTEAEWEKASRGGVANTRFPWMDYTNKISHAKANYEGRSDIYSYDLSSGYHPTYATGGTPYSSPVGSFAPNGYGLYDMAGNMEEWCWDWYDGNYYSSSPGTDPKGPASSPDSYRVLRGGSWAARAHYTRCANRGSYYPDVEFDVIGFRCARGL
jgi:sulfatase modifying factor 1